jgi:hypothetical protein
MVEVVEGKIFPLFSRERREVQQQQEYHHMACSSRPRYFSEHNLRGVLDTRAAIRGAVARNPCTDRFMCKAVPACMLTLSYPN